MTYLITIYDRKKDTTCILERNEDTIYDAIVKELGGWDNLHTVSTGGVNSIESEYMSAGTTKDNNFVFSILCFH